MPTPKDRTIHYLELPAADLAAAEEFYGGAFGWTFQSWGTEYLSFNDGNMDGGFYLSELRARYDNGSALIVLYGDNLEELVEVVKANGGTIAREIFSFPGGKRFHFLDPNGNELAIWSES